MDSSDVVALLIGIGLAGALVYAYEKGIIKVPNITGINNVVTSSNSTPSSNTTTNNNASATSSTISSSTTTSSVTSNSTSGIVTGTAYVGNGSNVSTNTFTSTPPSTSNSGGSSSANTSSSSTNSTNTSTVPTNSSGSGSYPSSSNGTGNVAPPTGNCAVKASCPSGISGECYQPNCSCFSIDNISINNNYNTNVQIIVSSEYVQYCNMTQGITWIKGSISPGVYNDPLPVAPSTSVGGAIYVYPPGDSNNGYPYLINYQFANGSNVVTVPEVDLSPTMTVTVTNSTQYNIVLANVSNLFNNEKVIIPPGGSGSIKCGNGWLISIGTVDPYENFPQNNPAPVSCFNQFVIVGSKPAINFINDADYNTCSQYSYTVSINGTAYSGDMGNGLNYNVQQVNYNSSSSQSSNNASSSNSSSGSTVIYGGVRPRIVPY